MGKPAVIFDIDGTVADLGHRLHHVTGGKKNWPAFFDAIPDDRPITNIIFLAKILAESGNDAVICCSGRPEDRRGVTEKQLADFGMPCDALYMRAENDTRPDHVVKSQLLDGILKDGYEPWLVIDDRQSVVDMWRERGLTCLQAKYHDEKSEYPATARLTLLVGPSGAGKSTWLEGQVAQFAYNAHPSHVISSDQTRHDLTGDFRNHEINEKAYEAIREVIKVRLKHGLPTVVDATNIRRKDRVGLATLCDVPVDYVVLNRSMEEKRATGKWRNEVVKNGEPFDLIGAHEQTFQSQLKDILRGDDLPNVTVLDLRRHK